MLDLDALAEMMAGLINEHVERELEPLRAAKEALEARLAEIEARPSPVKGDKGDSGVGIAGAVIDRVGGLVLTLSDGSTKDLGQVVGRDGIDAVTELRSGDLSDEEYAAKVEELLSADAPFAVEETGQEGANDADPALTTDVLEHDDG
jgi:hypothetical protein